jgi:hypothetical protein
MKNGYEYSDAASHRAATMRVIRLETIKRDIFAAQTDARRMPAHTEDYRLAAVLDHAHAVTVDLLKTAKAEEHRSERAARNEYAEAARKIEALETITEQTR